MDSSDCDENLYANPDNCYVFVRVNKLCNLYISECNGIFNTFWVLKSTNLAFLKHPNERFFLDLSFYV